MKKIVSLMLVMLMSISIISGCGKGDSVNTGEQVENEQESSQKGRIELCDGYWVVESMIMDEVEFEGEDLEGIFGPKDTIMSLQFADNGSIQGVYFEDYLTGTFTGTIDDFTANILDETLKGTAPENGKITFSFKDGSTFTLINQKEMPDAIADNPWVTYTADFSAEETCAMSNFMMSGLYLIEDDILYGLTYSVGNRGALAAIAFEMVGDFPEFKEPVILDGNGMAMFLCKHEDYLYYIRDNACICRVKVDGSGLEVLYEGSCNYLQMHENKLYFTDEKSRYVSIDMDGSNLETIIDREVYYPYFIDTDWMIFQDDADGESLHLYNTTHGTELNITYVVSYHPILDGKYLYYMEAHEEGQYLTRIDMSDPQIFRYETSDIPLPTSEFMIDEEYVYAFNNSVIPKSEWKTLSIKDDTMYESEMYVSEHYKIYHKFDEQGYVVGKYLMSKDMSGANPFR